MLVVERDGQLDGPNDENAIIANVSKFAVSFFRLNLGERLNPFQHQACWNGHLSTGAY